MTRQEITQLRKNIIEGEFSALNDKQKEAVLTVKGPLLVFDAESTKRLLPTTSPAKPPMR